MLKAINERFDRLIWKTPLAEMPRPQRALVQTFRLVDVLLRDLAEGDLSLRAMSLVYNTLLATVPLIALSFSVLKGFGVHNQVQPFLDRLLEPLGPRGAEISNSIIGFVDNVKAGVLGSVGLILLVWTVYSLLQKIEAGFNYVWHVRQPRSMVERFSNYLSVTLIGPVLVFSALGITASITSHAVVQSLMQIEPIGTIMLRLADFLPYLLVIGAFTFINLFIPNTRVRFTAALAGGVAAGVAWQSTGWLFARFVASSTRYTAIYSGFAGLFIFMFWLYLSWTILLLGAQLAFYWQNPQFVTRQRLRLATSGRQRERLALAAMYLIGYRHLAGETPWTHDALSRRLHVPGEALEMIMNRLERRGLVLATETPVGGYVPGRDLANLSLWDVVACMRRPDDAQDFPDRQLALPEAVTELAESLDGALCEALGGRSLRDLITQAESAELPVSIAQDEKSRPSVGAGSS
ncbi:MAG: YhjD/YihY/BrkB family envelope integrity protein [Gammaproteobacteria bacterium]|jgi:membrane protein